MLICPRSAGQGSKRRASSGLRTCSIVKTPCGSSSTATPCGDSSRVRSAGSGWAIALVTVPSKTVSKNSITLGAVKKTSAMLFLSSKVFFANMNVGFRASYVELTVVDF